ncbi:hypothetical protein AB833_25475 [Chromatiales bacterium (ex Bugula neritina AB1)]|nr:hypothetical protein AB833_25475 [Chromatiales bacterium (ex Bugula neritina AB1)]
MHDGEVEDTEYESLITSATIMLVDDEPINTDVLQTYLEGEGYTNFIATCESTKALDIMRQQKPDVVLLDLMMPDISGFDILIAMRRDKRLQHIPVVILTSSDDAETKLKALKLGAMDFLAKPVDASELALRLRNTLAAKAYQHQLVNYDQLTGLPKLDAFLDTAAATAATLKENNTNGAALHIYVENLKNINSSLGRDIGNKLLQEFSRKLEQCIRSTDAIRSAFVADARTSIARTGGDKFSIFLGPLDSPQTAAVLARRIIIDTSDPLILEGHQIFTNVKIGIAIYPDDAADTVELIHNAETAMTYARQHGGGEGYAFYSGEMNAESRQILAMETGLRSAIQRDELKVTYQPKVDLQSGKIIGAEALIRWISGDLGFVGPDKFIPIAERTGLIVPIGEWILEQACTQAAEWRSAFAFDFRLAVNVSIKQLHDSDMVSTVQRILDRSQLPAQSLTLELTEGMVMENAESNIELLHQLKSLGIKLSIDDFGTGYSSLSYLQRFPLDELKIDRSFIEEVKSEEIRTPIVRAMVSLAHDLGMTVVAEGIETDIQLNHMKTLQCELFQGYLCSKPVIAKAFSELLMKDYPRQSAA